MPRGDGHYSERVYDGKWPGIGPFELHLGPFREFAFFRGIQDEHRDHNSTDNLLKPYNLEVRANAARQSWDVAGMHLDIALAGRRPRAVRVLVYLPEADRHLGLPLTAEVIRPTISAQPRRTEVLKS